MTDEATPTTINLDSIEGVQDVIAVLEHRIHNLETMLLAALHVLNFPAGYESDGERVEHEDMLKALHTRTIDFYDVTKTLGGLRQPYLYYSKVSLSFDFRHRGDAGWEVFATTH